MPDTIEPRLKKLEAMEGIKNLFRLFKIPMATAESDTRSRKGNIMEVMTVVSSRLPGTSEKSGAMNETSGAGEQHAGKGDGADHHDNRGNHIVGEFPGCRRILFGFIISEHGDKGRAQRALGKQVPQEVRDSERNNIGIIGKPGAKQPGKDLLPDKPENAAYEHGKAHGAGRAGNGAGLNIGLSCHG